jgi:hypothetical protein
VRSRHFCFGHVPVAVRQGQRRDTAATGGEQLGRFEAEKSTYIRYYLYSGKLALAPMHRRRARVVGRSFAAGAPALTHVHTVGACGKKNSVRASGGPAGGRRVTACSGRWRALPEQAARRKYRSPNRHVGFKSFRKISNFRGLGCSRNLGAHHNHQAVTEFHNFAFSPAAISAAPPCNAASFEVF